MYKISNKLSEIINSTNNKYDNLKNFLDGKRVAVVGLGVSNIPLLDYLLKFNISITGFDKSTQEKLSFDVNEYCNKGVSFFLGENYADELINYDIVFRAPGIRPDNKIFEKVINNGAIITTEMEVFLELCPAIVFGITGSDGKTTTSTLIYNMLKEEGYKTYLGGNIGNPLIGELDNMIASDMVVLELSSFQLINMTKSPNIAVITNISPNHLDWHVSYEEYIISKKNICQYQKSPNVEGISNSIILNYDNLETRNILEEKLSLKTENDTLKIIPFSRKESLDSGVFINQNKIVYKDNKEYIEFININDIILQGVHNIENYMTAISAVKDFVKPETVKKVANSFTGVPHRIEFVREINGAKVYNDSIASSPSRTIAGLRSFNEKVILIAGGCDKKLSYDELGQEIINSVKKLVLIGQTARKIEASFISAANEINLDTKDFIYNATSFEDAVKSAISFANKGDIVILSPASTSFDLFKNFEERGNYFKQIVNNLQIN